MRMSKSTSLAAYACLGLLALGTGLSFVDPPQPHNIVLQHVPTVPALAALAWGVARRKLGGFDFACFAVFLALHVFGARWSYTFLPYDEWFQEWFGSDTNDWFGWSRNHYDRLVHVAFGACFTPPLVSWWRAKLGGWGTAWAVLGFVLGVSALYEIFEWLLTLAVDPVRADEYNGQQGDPWDAQKDMALAGAASALVLIVRVVSACSRRCGRSRLPLES